MAPVLDMVTPVLFSRTVANVRGRDSNDWRHPTVHPCVLDIAAAAQLLRVSESTVRRALRQGRLPGWRLGGQWRMWKPAVLLTAAGEDALRLYPLVPADEPELIDRAETADLLGIGPETCAALLRDGTIPSHRVGDAVTVWWPTLRDRMIATGAVEDAH